MCADMRSDTYEFRVTTCIDDILITTRRIAGECRRPTGDNKKKNKRSNSIVSVIENLDVMSASKVLRNIFWIIFKTSAFSLFHHSDDIHVMRPLVHTVEKKSRNGGGAQKYRFVRNFFEIFFGDGEVNPQPLCGGNFLERKNAAINVFR